MTSALLCVRTVAMPKMVPRPSRWSAPERPHAAASLHRGIAAGGRLSLKAALVALFIIALAPASYGSCPFGAFDGQSSDPTSDVLVLLRYSRNVNDAALLAGTRYGRTAGVTPGQITANIDNVSCTIDVNGDNQIDETDVTIIARFLAGYRGNALTDGLSLGSGLRPTPLSVQNYLMGGCPAASPTALFGPAVQPVSGDVPGALGRRP